MFICPNCKTDLTRTLGPLGVFWCCPNCGGRAVGIALLRRTVDPAVINDLWAKTYTSASHPGRPCPICAHAMLEAEVGGATRPLTLDVCKRCEFVWFDGGEFELMRPPPPKPHVLGDVDPALLPPAAREALAREKVKELSEKARDDDPVADAEWKTIPALLRFPVELAPDEGQSIPWATYTTSALIAVISIAAFFDLRKIIHAWGLIPADAWRDYGATFITSFFLHGGIVHLAGNLYFLIIFGRNVENFLGSGRWLGLLALSALVGDLAHIAADGRGTLPCIGASGGIAGLITFYALTFPHAELGFLFRWYFYLRWIRLPAWSAFGLWILFQLWGSYQQVHGFSNVSSLAHLGGTGVGVIAWLVWRQGISGPVPAGKLVQQR